MTLTDFKIVNYFACLASAIAGSNPSVYSFG
jgi:hypothetical protein